METQNVPPVHFVGAGPGDPELITVKGKSALEAADLIIYAGSLVPEALLSWNPEARHLNSASMNLQEIVSHISEAVDKGQHVVRLHTGDPSLYGAVFEQMQALERLGIAYRVIPGVTAAFAAAAAMNMEYTLPEVTQTLILTRISGRTPVPELEQLSRLAAHKASMAIYLSIAHVERVQEVICRHYGHSSICAVAYKVGHPQERILYTTADALARTAKTQEIRSQALILVGRAVAAAKERPEMTASKLYDAGFAHGCRS